MKNNQFQITTVIPVYNAEKTINKCVLSVIEQDYKGQIEIIIINDGSTDGTRKVLDKISSSDIPKNRSVRVIHKSNGGVSTARNVGIKEALFDWVALLDSDDYWLENKISEQVKLTHSVNAEFVGAVYQRNFYPFKWKKSFFSLSTFDVLKKWYPNTPSWLIKKALLVENGCFDEKQKYAEDVDLLLKVLQYTDVYVVNKPLVFSVNDKLAYGDGGLSGNMFGMYQGELFALKGALNRHQIPYYKYLIYYSWKTAKYYRRKVIAYLRAFDV